MTILFGTRPSSAKLAKLAWKSFFDAWRDMAPLFLAALLISAAVSVAVMHFTLPPMPMLSLEPVAMEYFFYPVFFVPFLIQAFSRALIAAPVAVAMHRAILLEQGGTEIFGRQTALYFVWLLALQLFAGVMFALSFQLVRGNYAFPLAVFLVICILGIHLAMIFPAVAIEAPGFGLRRRLETSFNQMDGNFWRLFGAVLLTLLPVAIPYLLAVTLLDIWDVFFLRHLAQEDAFQIVIAASGGIATIIFVMLGAAVVSWLYAWVRQKPVAGAETP